MTQTLDDIITRVAAYTVSRDMEHESWERATAVNGLLANEIRIDEAHELVESAVETQTSAGQLAYGYGDQASFRESRSREWTKYDLSSYFPTANTASMASSVLEFYDRTGDERYLDAVRKQYEYFETVDRTRDGGISRRDGPIELFTEVLYFLCPWYVRYGLLTDNDEPVEDAVHRSKSTQSTFKIRILACSGIFGVRRPTTILRVSTGVVGLDGRPLGLLTHSGCCRRIIPSERRCGRFLSASSTVSWSIKMTPVSGVNGSTTRNPRWNCLAQHFSPTRFSEHSTRVFSMEHRMQPLLRRGWMRASALFGKMGQFNGSRNHPRVRSRRLVSPRTAKGVFSSPRVVSFESSKRE